MTRRRSSGRRPARREERAVPPHYGDVERRLAEEVLYLHSLWRSGPPHPGGGSLATHVRADRRKRRRLERRAEPEDPGLDWPLAPSPPSPPASPSPRSWPDASSSSPTQQPQPQPSPAWLAQRAALRAAEEFFSGNASDDGDDDKEGSESEDEEEGAGDAAAAGFFAGLFKRDAGLRGYYERSYEEGEFMCMGCAGRRARRGRARRFRDCVGLVQHARAATRCGRRRAHRALASAVCRVLGWDIERLPSIVIDPRGTLGQSLAREGDSAAAATAHEAKENVDSRENDNEDAAKEDVDSALNHASLTDVVEVKDVDTGKNVPSCNGNDGEVHEQENAMESAEMEDTNDMDPLSSKETPKELFKAVQEKDVDTGKCGPSRNGNDGEVHEQENVMESAEMEDTNDMGPLSSKDTPKELFKAVQEEGVIDNKQEHAKSADDMGNICNVRLENNSSKEEAATENKEELTNNVVGNGDDDIGNQGNNLIDSTKVYSCTHAIWTSRMEIVD